VSKLSHAFLVAIAVVAMVPAAPRVAVAQDGGGPFGPPPAPLIDPGDLNPIPGTPGVPPDGADVSSPVWKPRSGYGFALTAGGGVGNYVNGDLRNTTGVPGNWCLRGSFGTRTYVGVEGAYLGAAGSISGFGLGGNSLLVRNGLELTLRVNAPLMLGRTMLEPYLFGGFGWDHYTVTNQTVTSSIDGDDDTVTTPFGAGFAMSWFGLFADGRFAYRPTFEEHLTHMPANDDLTNWTVSLQVGYEF
jgi:hypothetical protein